MQISRWSSRLIHWLVIWLADIWLAGRQLLIAEELSLLKVSTCPLLCWVLIRPAFCFWMMNAGYCHLLVERVSQSLLWFSGMLLCLIHNDCVYRWAQLPCNADYLRNSERRFQVQHCCDQDRPLLIQITTSVTVLNSLPTQRHTKQQTNILTKGLKQW